jgi:hypothetical protein
MSEMVIGGVEIPFDSRAAQSILKEIEAYERAQMEAALRAQCEAARMLGERTLPSDQHIPFQVHPAVYHHWGQRLGYECWEDDGREGFVSDILRDNPEIRVKTRRRNPSVYVSGYEGRGRRFHKSYD